MAMAMMKQLLHRMTVSPLLGVDIGSTAVKLVEVAQDDEAITLRHAAVASVEGQDPVTALKRLVAEAGLTTTRAALALASPRLIVKPFEFPAMPKKDLRNAIHLEAEQAILNGHSLNDMALDWHTVGAAAGAVRGLFSVVPKAILKQRIGVATAAGLCPSIVDVEGLALWNAYWTLIGSRVPLPKTVLLLNVGVQTTNVVIAKGPDELMLVRDIRVGGAALSGGQELEWLAEIRDSLGYARSQGGLRALDGIVVTGGGSGPNLTQLLKTRSAAPLTFWNPLSQLKCSSNGLRLEESAGPLFAIALGLALRQPT